VKAPRRAQLDNILLIPASALPDKANRPTRSTALQYKNYELTEKPVPSKDAKTTHRISPMGCICKGQLVQIIDRMDLMLSRPALLHHKCQLQQYY
jgi:hypothetical protein